MRMDDARGNTLDGSDLRSALVSLLTKRGVAVAEDAFVIKKKLTGAGRALYVVVASAGVEGILDSVLTSATGVDSCLPCGINVLTEAVLGEVVRYAAA